MMNEYDGLIFTSEDVPGVELSGMAYINDRYTIDYSNPGTIKW
jgi:hypothetical protein